jgi:hypothetical protein
MSSSKIRKNYTDMFWSKDVLKGGKEWNVYVEQIY